jgi:hypothetical protein
MQRPPPNPRAAASPPVSPARGGPRPPSSSENNAAAADSDNTGLSTALIIVLMPIIIAGCAPHPHAHTDTRIITNPKHPVEISSKARRNASHTGIFADAGHHYPILPGIAGAWLL